MAGALHQRGCLHGSLAAIGAIMPGAQARWAPRHTRLAHTARRPSPLSAACVAQFVSQRQLSPTVSGEYSWVVGPPEASGMSLGLTRRTEKLLLAGRLEVRARVWCTVCAGVPACALMRAVAASAHSETCMGSTVPAWPDRPWRRPLPAAGCRRRWAR